MAPVAAVGSLLRVTATAAADKQAYTVTADARTGAFSFAALPPGTYTLTFTTTTADPFPLTVTASVVAGATAAPAIPPITHDGIGRGTMKWVVDGQPYAATAFIKVYGDGKYFNLWGRAGSFGAGNAPVSDIELILPQDFGQPEKQTHPFAGAGTYALGGLGVVDPFGDCSVYPGNDFYRGVRYVSVGGSAVGTLHLTRYDAQQGTAAGTFEYRALAMTGVITATTPAQVAVTGGEFDITF